MKHLPKTFFISSVLAFSYTSAFADDLQCQKSYDTFYNISEESINVMKNGTDDQIKKFSDKYDYSYLFEDKHIGKSYFIDDWIDESEAKSTFMILSAMMKSGKFKITQYHLEKPKANFISKVGEICVIPSQSAGTYFDEEGSTKADVIFVRDLKTDQWRFISYYGSEKKEDFNEFFPDFPKSVKLSASKTINKSGRTLTSMDYSKKLFSVMGIEMPPEMIRDLEQKEKQTNMRKKMNGFD